MMTEKEIQQYQRRTVHAIRENKDKLSMKIADRFALVFNPDRQFYYEISLAVQSYFRRAEKRKEQPKINQEEPNEYYL